MDNLNSALQTWNDKLAEIWSLLTQDPATFKGGGIWQVMLGIHGALQGIGYGLLVLFFAVGVVKTCGSFVEVKRPEQALKLFIRFVLAKAAVGHGLDLMLAVLSVVQGIVSTIITQSGVSGAGGTTLPQEIIDKINQVGFWDSIPLWAVTLIGGLFITVLSFLMILTVYSRMFKLYMYTALAPIPLSTFAGEPTSNVGKNFLRSYAGVCLEGAVIALACIIFSVMAAAPLLRHGNLPACGGSQRLGGDCRVELCGRTHLQPVGAGGSCAYERPNHQGIDGTVTQVALVGRIVV